MPIPYNPNIRIVTETGKPEAAFKTFLLKVSKLGLFIGTGAPEGVIAADQGQFYMDDAGTTGNILYVKRDTDIGGDTSRGWILI